MNFILCQQHPDKRTRYSLKELLKGVTVKKMKALNKETSWAQEGKPAGREITLACHSSLRWNDNGSNFSHVLRRRSRQEGIT